MKKTDKIIIDFAVKFIERNFDNIEYNLADSCLPVTKGKLIKTIKKDVQLAFWIISELADWGMDKRNYLKENFILLSEDWTVLRIYDHYVKINYFDGKHEFTECKMVQKTFYCFETETGLISKPIIN